MNGCSDKRTLTCKTKRSFEATTTENSNSIGNALKFSRNKSKPDGMSDFLQRFLCLNNESCGFGFSLHRRGSQWTNNNRYLFMNELKLFLELFLFPRGCYCFVLTALLSHCFYWHNSFSVFSQFSKCYFLYSKTQLLYFKKWGWIFRFVKLSEKGKKGASHNNNSVKWSGENGVLHEEGGMARKSRKRSGNCIRYLQIR